MKKLILAFLMLLYLSPSVQALQTLSGDYVIVDTPINDDVLTSGGTININAPVFGVIAIGGDVNVNAPVKNDLIVVGGDINVNSDVGGKIVAAGGNINLKGDVGTNAVIAGGSIQIHSTIGKDALIFGGSFINAGEVKGNLTVRSKEFKNVGIAGKVDFKKSEFLHDVKGFFSIASILVTIGLIIPGIILSRLFPTQFMMIEEEVRKSPLRNTVLGFVLLIVSVVLIAILAITVVGLTLALILGMLFAIALILSTLFVSFSIGKKIASRFGSKINNIPVSYTHLTLPTKA